MALPALDAVVAEVRRIATVHPDCTPSRSGNWTINDDGELRPQSIVAEALLNLGATTSDIPQRGDVFTMYPESDPRAVWLRRIQTLENVGVCWGYAVRRADVGPVRTPIPQNGDNPSGSSLFVVQLEAIDGIENDPLAV